MCARTLWFLCVLCFWFCICSVGDTEAPLQLPFAPKPFRGELFSSWLLRLAAANFVPLDELLSGLQQDIHRRPMPRVRSKIRDLSAA